MQAMFGTFMVLFIANIVMVIWALVDAIRVPDDSMFKAGSKLIWVVVIVFTGLIGAIIYLVVGRPELGRQVTAHRPVDPGGPYRLPLPAPSAEIEPGSWAKGQGGHTG